jgi:biopolymer transport protein ExbB
MNLVRNSIRALGAIALLAPAAVFAQAAAAAPAVTKQTLLQKLNMPTIYILAVCSFIIIWLAIDIWSKTAPSKILPKQHIEALRDFFRQGDYVGAYNYAKTNVCTFTNVVRVGLAYASEGKAVCEEAIVSQITKENGALQARIAYLSVIGVIAPMIGLTGTVFGMIDAFASLGAAGAADPSALSAAIGKVLYATAGGLVVAIPAFVFYYLLRNRTSFAMFLVQDEVTLLFRRMPYEHMAAANVSESEIYANTPNWMQGGVGEAHPSL